MSPLAEWTQPAERMYFFTLPLHRWGHHILTVVDAKNCTVLAGRTSRLLQRATASLVDSLNGLLGGIPNGFVFVVQQRG